MKKINWYIMLLLIVLGCKSIQEDISPNSEYPWPFNGPGVTREQVVAIATKYGFQDSIAPGYKATRLIPPPEEVYPYLSEEFFDNYFARWRKGLDRQKYLSARRQKLNSFHTLQEYFEYIENEPEEYGLKLRDHGGKKGYDEYKKDVLAGKYHIYICNPEVGTVTIVPADGDKPGTINGHLLRNEN